MPPRRRTRPAPPDVDALRAALEAGRIVRVGIIPSDQFPEGVTGRVRRIGDPAQDGEEYLFVEVPVGGAKDVLPFAPGDLTGSPPRKQPATVPSGGGGGSTGRTTGPAGPVALFAAAASAPTARTPPAVATPVAIAGTSTETGSPTRTPPSRSGAPADSSGRLPGAGEPDGTLPPPSRRSAGAAARGKRPPVTITISTTGDESASWRVEARIGARVAVRPTSVPPSRVWEIVESLGESKLTAVVQTLLDEHRRSTQARADALAAELAALQNELSSYPSAEA